MSSILRWGLGVWLLAVGPPARGQAAADSILQRQYSNALGPDSRLYNGPEYVDYVRRNTKGHRFFASDQLQSATVTYAGCTYRNVPIRYDLVRNQLVLEAPGGGLKLSLLSDQVADFTVAGHSFIRLVTDSSGDSPLRTGFYDLLVDGPVQLLAARRKILRERTGEKTIESEITATIDYFACKDHHYYPVAKAASILHVFPENETVLRRYVKENKLKFKPATREPDLITLVRYQTSLQTAAPH